MKIYTKKGDSGQTSLFGGKQISKDDVRVHAYGTVDECSAAIGLARSFGLNKELDTLLDTTQSLLFQLGADLAAPEVNKKTIIRISEKDIVLLETWIDELDKVLPPLKQFVIQGGTNGAAALHLARNICRRAERWTVTLSKEDESAVLAVKFLNRLSDFLFVAARTANYQANLSDAKWTRPQTKEE